MRARKNVSQVTARYDFVIRTKTMSALSKGDFLVVSPDPPVSESKRPRPDVSASASDDWRRDYLSYQEGGLYT